ncbi:MAG: exodeoxyribonuclease V subunit gamma [Oscillospiraceae bacterium]|nr:exodeoxyribonuclease V subunit gamma [Oscillospiraceae bacterium]
MSMRIIRGAIGSGKSERCLCEIENIHEKYPQRKCIIIVPNHYSYETEKRFVERFGGTGLNNIEVLTLRKMAINCLTAAELNHLTPAGKQMLIYKSVHEYCEETDITDARLIAAMKKPGFLDIIGSLISEMKRYSISPSLLFESTDKIEDNDTLKNKVTAVSRIYGAYNDFIEHSGCSDSEDDIKRLAEFIRGSEMFDRDTYVWFDKFDEFMPHQARVIEALLQRRVNVTVCVNYPEENNEVYAQLENTFLNAERLAYEYGGDEVISLTANLKHLINNAELKFLFENWNNYHAVYNEATENVFLFEGRDAYSEVENAAGRITDLVREDGMRFRDIAVLCGNAEEYQHLVKTVFEEYEIPYFTDSTIILSDHPIAMQVLSVFDILDEDWSYESVFAYLRAGFIYERRDGKIKPINQDDVDRLENFVIKYGIRGQSRWLCDEKWSRGGDIISTAFGEEPEENEDNFIDALRRKITVPILAFKDATSRRKTALEHATALFEYFESIDLYAGLKAEIARLRNDGMMNEAEQFTQIWNLLLDVLNQAVVTVGNEKMNRAEFGEYIRAGLSKCEIRIIPSGVDQVYVGNVERSSRSNVRAMFVIGAVSGTFPDEFVTEGFFSNNDRNALEEKYSITLAPDTRRKTEKQYFKVYKAMCAVTEKLFLSYPLQNSEGRALRASRMITDIVRKFPKISVSDNLVSNASGIGAALNGTYISSPKATIHRILINKSHKGKSNPVWEAAYNWYKKNGEWDNMLSMIDRAEKFSLRDIRLDSEIAEELYRNRGAYSASRLNEYAKCPFAYFIKYGLRAYERDEWEITPADVGTYAHAVIREFCERVEDGAKTSDEKLDRWRGLRERGEDGDAPIREEILDEIIDTTKDNILTSNSRDKERTANIFGRMGKTIRHAARIVHMSFKNGQYAEDGLERHFEIDLGENIAVRGDIDRVDVYNEIGGDARVRIIDYKTGNRAFDVVDVVNRIDMQPIIYALAARELVSEEFNKNTAVTGVYYNKVRDDFQKLKQGDGVEKAFINHKKSRKLEGITFVDSPGDNRVIYDMDSRLENGEQSEFLDVSLDGAGAVKPSDTIRTRAEIDGLMSQVAENIIEMDKEIKSGEISLMPYKSTQGDSCEFCEYADVCAFDGNKRAAREKEGNKKEVWERMYLKGGGK